MSTMTAEQFDREAAYRAALAIARLWLREGFITEKEYAKLDAIFKRNFSPIWGGYCGSCGARRVNIT